MFRCIGARHCGADRCQKTTNKKMKKMSDFIKREITAGYKLVRTSAISSALT